MSELISMLFSSSGLKHVYRFIFQKRISLTWKQLLWDVSIMVDDCPFLANLDNIPGLDPELHTGPEVKNIAGMTPDQTQVSFIPR